MLHHYWFRPKRVGYGATPSTWEGWIASIVYGLIVLIAATVMLLTKSDEHSVGAWIVFVIFVACMTAIFVLFCKAKTQGDWHWRNGREPD